jgi:ubiquinone/menaquinone biosynthesis C-methylase UbiE
MDAPDPFNLDRFPVHDFVTLVSPPQNFDGGEEAYDEAVGGANREDLLACGRGALRLARHYSRRPIQSLVEIGAGGGTCSLGLVSAASDCTCLITDTSPRFLQMIRGKLARHGIDRQGVRFATLSGEDLQKLPVQSADLVVVASALHHVSDWRRFLADSFAILRPGGTLVFQEPCREGNLMMALALDFALSPAWGKSDELSADDRRRITRLRDSIYFLNDSTVDKVGEDKHVFLMAEVADVASQSGFVRSAFYANYHFEDLLTADLSVRMASSSISDYLRAFLKHHHGVSAEGLGLLDKHLFPLMRRLDDAFVARSGVPIMGCMALCR